MSIISIPFSFAPGTTIVSSQVNSCFSVIYNDYNGNIGNTNLSSSVLITDNHLAQIVDASKVSGTALTGMASLPSGAGVLPTANLPVGTSAGNILQLVAGSSGGTFPSSVYPFYTQNVVTGSRALGNVYQNTTGKTMFVSSTLNVSSGNVIAYTDSASNPTTAVAEDGLTGNGNVSFMVLTNNYYKLVASSSASITYWVEWY